MDFVGLSLKWILCVQILSEYKHWKFIKQKAFSLLQGRGNVLKLLPSEVTDAKNTPSVSFKAGKPKNVVFGGKVVGRGPKRQNSYHDLIEITEMWVIWSEVFMP